MRPTVALTMGDAAGIGPELIVRCWQEPALHEWCRPLAVGHPGVLRRAAALTGSRLRVLEVDAPEQAAPTPNVLPCLCAAQDEVLDVTPGRVDARAGRAAYHCLAAATELALSGRLAALVTAPLNKEAMNAAGFAYPGHTEALADLCGSDDVAMMLYLAGPLALPSPPGGEGRVKGTAPGGAVGNHGLAVVHVTLHMALADVPRQITCENVLAKARQVDAVLRRLDESASRRIGESASQRVGDAPCIGLAALNPHAGEGGLFGREEQDVLIPAVRAARAEGIDLHGPFPADSLFARAFAGEFDAVVAMYHDQGHIALKLMDFHRAVNVTLGLPIVRTSPTYGTAFDIAWQGAARAEGMLEAVRVAALLVHEPALVNWPSVSQSRSLACQSNPVAMQEKHSAMGGPVMNKKKC